MSLSKGQGELFTEEENLTSSISQANSLFLNKDLIEAWQRRISTYQESLFKNISQIPSQPSFFDLSKDEKSFETLDLLELTPLPLNFWRWPEASHTGAAIYIVMDKLKEINSYIVLYIGETIAAEKRWKGDHDCKNYLETYSEACQKAGLKNQLSIRFLKDVPTITKARRNLEQQLIQKWLPAFNKETRGFWNTPFTN